MWPDWHKIFLSRTSLFSLVHTKQLESSNLKLDDKIKHKDGAKKLNVEHTVKWSSLQLASMTPLLSGELFSQRALVGIDLAVQLHYAEAATVPTCPE
jgi:hypothetical protein